MQWFLTLIWHELTAAYRYKADWVHAWLFFVMVVSLFPLAITPEPAILQTIAPGLIWMAALLSMLLALNYFLRPDYEDGSLVFLLLSPRPLSLLLLAKIVAHWLISALPLIIITPLLAWSLHLSGLVMLNLLATLILGTPILSLLGAVAMALTVALRNNTLLLMLLVLPLCVPVLIFGAGTVINVGLGGSGRGGLSLLAALLVLTITLAPLAASAALKLYEG